MAFKKFFSTVFAKPETKSGNLLWNENEHRIRSVFRIVLFVIALQLAAFGLTVIIGFLQRAINSEWASSLTASESSSYIFQLFLNVILPLGAIVVSFWIAARFLDKRRFGDFGFHFTALWWKDLAFGLGLGAFLVILIFSVEWAFGFLEITGTKAGNVPGVPFLTGILCSILFFITIGIFEEMLMRGYLLRNLAEGMHLRFIPAKWALFISFMLTSVIFGALHFANPGFSFLSMGFLIVAGILLGLGYVLTGNLAISIGLHITWNFFQGTVFGFPVSGVAPDFSFISIHQEGSAWLTGAAFGPEAGVLGLAAMLLGCLAIYYYVRWTRKGATWQEKLAIFEPLPDSQKKKDTQKDK
jgi:uncharacterized protein